MTPEESLAAWKCCSSLEEHLEHLAHLERVKITPEQRARTWAGIRDLISKLAPPAPSFTYPKCAEPKCAGDLTTLTQMHTRRCFDCMQKKGMLPFDWDAEKKKEAISERRQEDDQGT